MAPEPYRLYTDLIFKCFAKYPALEPSRPTRLGDYGRIDKETGGFKVFGNIFDEGLADGIIRLTICEPEDELCVQNKVTKSLGVDVEPGVNLANIVQCQLTKRWKFSKSPGAALWLIKPVLSYIGPERDLAKIMSADDRRDYALVTEIYSCPAYAYILQAKRESEIALGFSFSMPLPMAPLVSPQAGVLGEWVNNGEAKFFRTGVLKTTDQRPFVPLFRLQALRPKQNFVHKLATRSGSVLEEDVKATVKDDDVEEGLSDECPPWEILDSEGNEVDQSTYMWI